jgi:hypothetical protein
MSQWPANGAGQLPFIIYFFFTNTQLTKKPERKKRAYRQENWAHTKQLTTESVDVHVRNHNMYSERDRKGRQYE